MMHLLGVYTVAVAAQRIKRRKQEFLLRAFG